MSKKISRSKSGAAKKAMKKSISKKTLPPKPSETVDDYWIFSVRRKGFYPASNENSGKWLIFAKIDTVDIVWEKIRLATEEGLLGGNSKVATAKPNPNAPNSNTKVICVYTYDYTDREDVMRIRGELRKMGVETKIPYKSDNVTRQGQYSVKGNSNLSVYIE
jgi:hypothetical protein